MRYPRCTVHPGSRESDCFSHYNHLQLEGSPGALLLSALDPTQPPDEIIIADDGSREDTRDLVSRISRDGRVPFVHIWQRDKGFRAARIRNKAIAKATVSILSSSMETSFYTNHSLRTTMRPRGPVFSPRVPSSSNPKPERTSPKRETADFFLF